MNNKRMTPSDTPPDLADLLARARALAIDLDGTPSGWKEEALYDRMVDGILRDLLGLTPGLDARYTPAALRDPTFLAALRPLAALHPLTARAVCEYVQQGGPAHLAPVIRPRA